MTETRTFADRLTSATFGRMLRRATVAQVTDLTDEFRRIDLTLPKAADWAAGQKVQVQVRGLQLRTYTPFGWTDSGDAVSLLAFRHGAGDGEDTPADVWLAAHAEVGSEVAFTGPGKAVRLDNLTAAPIFVGDETSFALTAAAAPTQTAAAQVYEVTDTDQSKDVLDALGLGEATLVERTTDDGHHGDLSERVIEAVTAHPDHPLVLTGKAQTIKAVRQSLKTAGLSPEVRVKAHWDPRRSGLD